MTTTTTPPVDHLRILDELIDGYEEIGYVSFAKSLRKGSRRRAWRQCSKRLVDVDPSTVAGAKTALDKGIRAIHFNVFRVQPLPPPVVTTAVLLWRGQAPDAEGVWSVRDAARKCCGDHLFDLARHKGQAERFATATLTYFGVPVGELTWPDGWMCRKVVTT